MENIFLKDIFSYGSNIFDKGLILSTLFIIINLIIAKCLNKYLKRIILKAAKKRGKEDDMLFLLICNAVKFIIYTIVFIIIMYEIIPFRSFSAAALGMTGVITVALTLGAQEMAANLVSGVMLSVYEPFNKGDLVYLIEKNIIGVIEDLNFRHCTIRTFENSKIIVPNKVLNEAIVENRGSSDSEPYYNLFKYGISYDSDFNLAIKLIKDFLLENDLVLKKDDIWVALDELGDSSLLIKVRCYTKTPGIGLILKAQLNEYILNKFKENNIEIPYPHLSVELKKDH